MRWVRAARRRDWWLDTPMVTTSAYALADPPTGHLHDVRPLLDAPTSPCRRDAIVCTVNYAGTYEV